MYAAKEGNLMMKHLKQGMPRFPCLPLMLYLWNTAVNPCFWTAGEYIFWIWQYCQPRDKNLAQKNKCPISFIYRRITSIPAWQQRLWVGTGYWKSQDWVWSCFGCGQEDMKLALTLNIINPILSGVLIRGEVISADIELFAELVLPHRVRRQSFQEIGENVKNMQRKKWSESKIWKNHTRMFML